MFALIIGYASRATKNILAAQTFPGVSQKATKRRGRGSLLGPEAKNRTAIVFDTTRGP